MLTTDFGLDKASSKAFIFLGESGARGDALNTELPPEDKVVNKNLQILNTSTLKLEPMQIGVNTNPPPTPTDRHGWENGLQFYLRRITGNQSTYLCKVGVGGSTVNQWRPGTTNWNLYLTRLGAFKTQLAHVNINWIIWFSLGLNDANQRTDPLQWRVKTQDYINRARAEIPQAVVHVLSPLFTTTMSATTSPLLFNEQLKEIEKVDPYFHLIPSNGTNLKDNLHWNASGNKELARRMLLKYRSIEINGVQQGLAEHTVVITAVDYKSGQNGETYFSKTAGNFGGEYRDDDVDISNSPEGYYVKGTQSGEWITYDLSLSVTTLYKIVARVASSDSAEKTLSLTIGGQTATASFVGDGDGFFDVELGTLSIDEGFYTGKVDFLSNGIDLLKITLEPAARQSVSSSDATAPTVGNVASRFVATPDTISPVVGNVVSGFTATPDTTAPVVENIVSSFTATPDTTAPVVGNVASSFTSTPDAAAPAVGNIVSSFEPTPDATAPIVTNVVSGFTATPTSSEPASFRIDAWQFRDGPDGSFDSTANQRGDGTIRPGTAVDLRRGSYLPTDPPEGYVHVGWTTTGEWLKYDITVPKTGTYSVTLMATSDSNSGTGTLMLTIGGETSNVLIEPNSSWTNFKPYPGEDILLTAGETEARIDIVAESYNFRWIDLVEIT